MRRTRYNVNVAGKKQQLSTNEMVDLMGTLASRMNYFGRLGMSYNDNRDIYKALGYKKTLYEQDYLDQYFRQDIAKAIIDKPVKATWRGKLELLESDDDKETQFEKTWKDLNKQLNIKGKLMRLDKLTGLGRYAIIVLGLDDVSQPGDFSQPVTGGKRQLRYIQVLSELHAQIMEFENDPSNPRFGLPRIYEITMTQPKGNSISVRVHWTRVVHCTGETLENEVYGIPRLEAVFNRLKDLEKLLGGSAEMYWRGARPGYAGTVDKDYELTQPQKDKLHEQMDEYEHDLRRFLINEGIDIKSLDQQIADPKNHVEVQLQMISAVTDIPKRMLMGSERGELSSAQDRTEWLSYVQGRREEYAEIHILFPFIRALMQYGVLPKSEDYTINWEELFTVSEKEKAEVGQLRAKALNDYSNNANSQFIVSFEAFIRYFLGLDEETANLIMEMGDAELLREEREQESDDIIEEESSGEESE